jgi:hypothetical protein
MACRSLTALGPLAAALLFGAAGCGGGKPWAVNDQVEGTVKLDGAPLANVFVQFVPDVDPKVQAPTATGTTDDKGKFKLAFDDQKPGAVVGKNVVVVVRGRTAGGGVDDRDPQGRQAASGAAIPQAYSLAAKTPLSVEVTADRHTYDLTLSRNPGSRPKK